MTLRDRRGPLAALLLLVGYTLIVMGTATQLAMQTGLVPQVDLYEGLSVLLLLTLAGLAWRVLLRAIFTAREFGPTEGLRAVPRVLMSNIISIMSGRRALAAYIGTLRGAPVVWDKTEHSRHPAAAFAEEKTA